MPHAVQHRVDAGVQAEHRGGGERCAGGIGDRPESVLEGAHGIDLVKTVRGEHELYDRYQPEGGRELPDGLRRIPERHTQVDTGGRCRQDIIQMKASE